ncbi:MAG: indole-3-glycerol phosphate synthase TrpC [Candidatus Omnitrophica bacterium]|nr:indole-3-glycerol phosphate synthase TrpC [Candidatus Omnitrophota bacterium]
MILNKIIEEKKKEIDGKKAQTPIAAVIDEADRLKSERKHNFFKHSISKPHKIHLIAEVKKASPSAGVIRRDFDPLKIASIYEANGASAISVLTDEKFFKGSLSHLEAIKKNVSVPVLRKEFVIDEYQIYESVCAGADALLLIADLLSPEELKRFLAICESYSMDALVEIHSEEDAEKAMNTGCAIIGINNRNLHSLKVDVKTTPRLLKMISEDKIIVSESGIHDRKDIQYLLSLGINAVLIGEALMASDDIGSKIRDLLS